MILPAVEPTTAPTKAPDARTGEEPAVGTGHRSASFVLLSGMMTDHLPRLTGCVDQPKSKARSAQNPEFTAMLEAATGRRGSHQQRRAQDTKYRAAM